MDVQPRTLEEWLDDLCVRFIVNLPQSELSGFDRIGTHVEEAHWFYEDFIRPLDPTLPQMSLRTFSLRIFQHCPLTSQLGPELHEKAYSHWIGYKKRIPVRGAILLNEAMDSVVLVKGWSKSSSWMFPRGKINQGEDDLDCAIREVYEETGFHAAEAGLIPEDRSLLPSFDVVMRDQHVKLFVIPHVPMNVHFEARTRKEISKIEWYRLADLPTGRTPKKQGQDNSAATPNANKFFMISSFLGPLNKWIRQQRRKKDRSRNNHRNGHLSQAEIEDVMTEEEGMATETAPEPTPVFTTAESYEAASRELQRLLKIQAPTQRSQAGMSGAEQDKGKALLAMLQQKPDAPTPPQMSNQQQHPHLPHTPMDHVYNVAPQPHTPQHPHGAHRLGSGSYQAPPSFPIQPDDINNQLRSVLGVSTAPVEHAVREQHQAPNQQLAMMMASVRGDIPALAHPQPLPRQTNHILVGAAAPTHPVQDDRPLQMQQQMNMPSSLPTGMNLPQQLVANLRQPPAVLDNSRLALLNAFKKDTSPAKEPSLPVLVSQPPAVDAPQPNPQQPAHPAALGSPYVGPASINAPGQRGLASSMPQQGSPHPTIPQAALRPSNVSQTQQKALLDIFKQPSISSPQRENARPDLKENGVPLVSDPGTLHQQPPSGFTMGLGTRLPVPGANNGAAQTDSGFGLPYGARTIAMRPKEPSQLSSQQQQSSQSRAQLLGAFAVDGAGGESRIHGRHTPNRQAQNDVVTQSPYNQTGQHSLPQPANTTSFPNTTPRRQDADPQQLQRLMSLFTTPSSGAPPRALASPAAIPKGKEPVHYQAGNLSSPSSRMGSLGPSPGLDGVGRAASMIRRSSQQQTLISPENEKFLLNYLKTAVSDPPK